MNLESEKWYGKQQCLSIEHKKSTGDCLPCPISCAANANVCLSSDRFF